MNTPHTLIIHIYVDISIPYYLSFAGDKSLPEGWKIRSHQWWCQKRNSHRIHYEFLSPDNEFFKSRKAVVEHMTSSGLYTAEQIETVKQQATIITDRTIKKKPAAAAGPTRQDLSPCNPLIGWKTGNTTLPNGWKIKRHEYANQTVYFYMSPKGDIIKSRRAVIDYMFKDESYTEKDYNIVISGAKQRKAVLQELYDAKARREARRKKRSRSDATEEEEDEDDFEEEAEEPKIDSDEELDPVEDDDKFEDAKKCHKNKKPEKEPVLPTRRSGRIRIKEEKQKDKDDSGAEDSESEGESMSPSGEKAANKRRVEETESAEGDNLTPEPKRKRGRPPKVLSQPFDLIGLKGESEEEMIADTLLKVEQKMGDSLVKLDGNLFKVELSSQEDIKDFNLTDAPEIKMGGLEPPLHNSIKDEFKISSDEGPNDSIQVDPKEENDSQFYVKDGKADLAKVSPVANNSETSAEAAYAVVVNVLKEIVSSISD